MSTSEIQPQDIITTTNDEQIQPFTSQHITTTSSDVGNPHFRRHHVNSLNNDVIIRQLPSEGLSFQLWPAATTLFSLLDSHKIDSIISNHYKFNHRLRILELGSGTGLVGIAAAAILGADVTVTDLAHVIPNLKFNVSANAQIVGGGGGTVVTAELSWGNVEQMEVVGKEYDVIMGSDVVYHDHLYEPLINTLKYLLVGGERKRMFLMAHLKRWKKEAVFFKKAKKFFEVDVIYRDSPSDGKRVGVIVYRFVGKQCSTTTSSTTTLGGNFSKLKLENDV